MALQIEVKTVSVQGWAVTLNLTCWPDGETKQYPVVDAEGNVDMKNAVIYQDFSENIKSYVEDKTKSDLVTEIAMKMRDAMQAVIDKYKREQDLLNSSILEQARNGIETGLEG